MDVLSSFFTSFLDKVYSFLIHVLPRSPFRQYLKGYDALHSGLIRAVNYFVPIPMFIVITYAWVTAMVLYYIYHGLVMKLFSNSDKANLSKWGDFIKKLLKIFKK